MFGVRQVGVLSVAVGLLAGAAAGGEASGTLTFHDRVVCQREIERVYWQLRGASESPRVRAFDDGGAGDDVGGQVFVGCVDSGVEHGDGGRACGVDNFVGEVPADLGEGPLVGVCGVVRGACDGAGVVLCDVDDVGVLFEGFRLVVG